MPSRMILILVTLLLTQGCSHALSHQIRDTADRSIPYEKLSADPDAYAGKTVILGGEIIETRNTRNGTIVEVRQKKLDFWDKPRRTRRSSGVFLILHHARLDPLVYSMGRDITVAGEVTRARKAVTGEDLTGHLILRAREMKLWPRERRSSDTPQWLDPLYDRHAPHGSSGM